MHTGLFVGRFQPFHNGHLATVKFALRTVDRLIVVVGSAQKSHEPRNPFTAGERIEMIKECLDSQQELDWSRILIVPVPDLDVHSLWTRYLDLFVPRYNLVLSNDPLTLLLFRERGVPITEPPFFDRSRLSGTEVRMRIRLDKDWQQLVPSPCVNFIVRISGVDRIKSLADLSGAINNPNHDMHSGST